MNKFKFFLNYGLIFLATFLILQSFQGKNEEPVANLDTPILIEAAKNNYAIGKDVKVNVNNFTGESLTLNWSGCNDYPFDVLKFTSEGYVKVLKNAETSCSDEYKTEIANGKKEQYSLINHTYSLFPETGRYKFELTHNENTYQSPEFTIKKPGFITNIWREAIYNPILNALVALIIYLPGHHLGLAVILLTAILRTILLFPSMRAIRAQQSMQAIQPKIEALKKKHGDDQARLAQETMLLWKKHKVHPLSSCLPMLIQFPILIALFYVVRGGLSPDRSFLVYDFLPEFSFTDINPMFLDFNLLETSMIVFPIIIASMQFIQMQLMMAKSKKKKKGDSKAPEGMAKEMENANKMMRYVMPIMIGVFASQMPAAVSLYWGTSTFYGILQQLVVNKKGTSADTTSNESDEVKVRVINKKHGKTN